MANIQEPEPFDEHGPTVDYLIAADDPGLQAARARLTAESEALYDKLDSAFGWIRQTPFAPIYRSAIDRGHEGPAPIPVEADARALLAASLERARESLSIAAAKAGYLNDPRRGAILDAISALGGTKQT